MSQLSLSVPSELQHWVDERVATGAYADVGEYLRQLIRRDQDEYEADVRRVRRLIDDGLASGVLDQEPEDVLDEIIAGIRRSDG